MKKLVIVAFAFAASLAAQANYSGIYKGVGGMESVKYGSVPATAQMTLLQAGSSISGTLKLGNGTVMKLTSGSISGSQITFAVVGGTGSLVVKGTQLQGKLTSSKGQILDIVFTKQ
jgi:tetrahydromethanopterin S-methyltransferase subunit A